MKPKNRKMIVLQAVLVILTAMVTSCFDPQSPRILFEYSGRQMGTVFVLVKDNPLNPSVIAGRAFFHLTVDDARRAYDGSPNPINIDHTHQLYNRSSFETGGMRFQAWIDLDGDDFVRCQLPGLGGNLVSPDCGPEAGDPSGITPPPPYGATIPLVIRDPN